MSGALAHREPTAACSPVVTLRLLAMVEEARSTTVDEPEQMTLPFEWAWSVPARREAPPLEERPRQDPKQWGGRIALAAFEIMLGRRPAGQLARMMDAKTLHLLSEQTKRYAIARRTRRPGSLLRPRLTSIRCYQPHPDAAEITAVIHDGDRIRAVAMRLSARGGQWITTAFEMG